MTREMKAVLHLQWHASRWLILPLVLICVGLPQAVLRLSVRHANVAGAADNVVPAALLSSLQSASGLFPYLAAVTGALIALTAWNWDHRTNHIYALALPVSRGRYALLKLWAGAVALLVPTLALLIGAWIATSGVTIPDGLRAYPFTFAARFLLAGTLVYATMFALASGTIRTTLTLIIALLVVVVGGEILIGYIEEQMLVNIPTPVQLIETALTRWPGPFEVFSGNWLMIDV